MNMAVLKKLTQNERVDFHCYKFTGNAGRKGVKARKTELRRATRRVLKNIEIGE